MAVADPQRSMTLLNEHGDIEIAWDSQHDDAMREIIAKKMAEGVRFFIIKPLFGSTIFMRKAQMKTLADLNSNRVSIKDDALAAMFSAGKIAVFRSGETAIDTQGVAKTPDDVINNKTVGVRALQGG